MERFRLNTPYPMRLNTLSTPFVQQSRLDPNTQMRVITDPLLNMSYRRQFEEYQQNIFTETLGRVEGTAIGAGLGAGIGTIIGAIASFLLPDFGLLIPAGTAAGAAIAGTTATTAGAAAATAATTFVGLKTIGTVAGATIGATGGLISSDYTTHHATMDIINNTIIASFKQNPAMGVLNSLAFTGKSMDLLMGGEAIRATISAAITGNNMFENIARAYGTHEDGRTEYDFSVIREQIGLDLGSFGNTVFDMTGEIITDPGAISGTIGKLATVKSANKAILKSANKIGNAMNFTINDVIAKNPKLGKELARALRHGSKEELVSFFKKTNIGVKTQDAIDDTMLSKFMQNVLDNASKNTAYRTYKMFNQIDEMDDFLTAKIFRLSNYPIGIWHTMRKGSKWLNDDIIPKIFKDSKAAKVITDITDFIFGNRSRVNFIKECTEPLREYISFKQNFKKYQDIEGSLNSFLNSEYFKGDNIYKKMYQDYIKKNPDADIEDKFFKEIKNDYILYKDYSIKKLDEQSLNSTQTLLDLKNKLKSKKDEMEKLMGGNQFAFQIKNKDEYQKLKNEYDELYNEFKRIAKEEQSTIWKKRFLNRTKSDKQFYRILRDLKKLASLKIETEANKKAAQSLVKELVELLNKSENEQFLDEIYLANGYQATFLDFLRKNIDDEITKDLKETFDETVEKYENDFKKFSPRYRESVINGEIERFLNLDTSDFSDDALDEYNKIVAQIKEFNIVDRTLTKLNKTKEELLDSLANTAKFNKKSRSKVVKDIKNLLNKIDISIQENEKLFSESPFTYIDTEEGFSKVMSLFNNFKNKYLYDEISNSDFVAKTNYVKDTEKEMLDKYNSINKQKDILGIFTPQNYKSVDRFGYFAVKERDHVARLSIAFGNLFNKVQDHISSLLENTNDLQVLNAINTINKTIGRFSKPDASIAKINRTINLIRTEVFDRNILNRLSDPVVFTRLRKIKNTLSELRESKEARDYLDGFSQDQSFLSDKLLFSKSSIEYYITMLGRYKAADTENAANYDLLIKQLKEIEPNVDDVEYGGVIADFVDPLIFRTYSTMYLFKDFIISNYSDLGTLEIKSILTDIQRIIATSEGLLKNISDETLKVDFTKFIDDFKSYLDEFYIEDFLSKTFDERDKIISELSKRLDTIKLLQTKYAISSMVNNISNLKVSYNEIVSKAGDTLGKIRQEILDKIKKIDVEFYNLLKPNKNNNFISAFKSLQMLYGLDDARLGSDVTKLFNDYNTKLSNYNNVLDTLNRINAVEFDSIKMQKIVEASTGQFNISMESLAFNYIQNMLSKSFFSLDNLTKKTFTKDFAQELFNFVSRTKIVLGSFEGVNSYIDEAINIIKYISTNLTYILDKFDSELVKKFVSENFKNINKIISDGLKSLSLKNKFDLNFDINFLGKDLPSEYKKIVKILLDNSNETASKVNLNILNKLPSFEKMSEILIEAEPYDPENVAILKSLIRSPEDQIKFVNSLIEEELFPKDYTERLSYDNIIKHIRWEKYAVHDGTIKRNSKKIDFKNKKIKDFRYVTIDTETLNAHQGLLSVSYRIIYFDKKKGKFVSSGKKVMYVDINEVKANLENKFWDEASEEVDNLNMKILESKGVHVENSKGATLRLHELNTKSQQGGYSIQQIFSRLNNILNDDNTMAVMHNASFDIKQLLNAKYELDHKGDKLHLFSDSDAFELNNDFESLFQTVGYNWNVMDSLDLIDKYDLVDSRSLTNIGAGKATLGSIVIFKDENGNELSKQTFGDVTSNSKYVITETYQIGKEPDIKLNGLDLHDAEVDTELTEAWVSKILSKHSNLDMATFDTDNINSQNAFINDLLFGTRTASIVSTPRKRYFENVSPNKEQIEYSLLFEQIREHKGDWKEFISKKPTEYLESFLHLFEYNRGKKIPEGLIDLYISGVLRGATKPEQRAIIRMYHYAKELYENRLKIKNPATKQYISNVGKEVYEGTAINPFALPKTNKILFDPIKYSDEVEILSFARKNESTTLRENIDSSLHFVPSYSTEKLSWAKYLKQTLESELNKLGSFLENENYSRLGEGLFDLVNSCLGDNFQMTYEHISKLVTTLDYLVKVYEEDDLIDISKIKSLISEFELFEQQAKAHNLINQNILKKRNHNIVYRQVNRALTSLKLYESFKYNIDFQRLDNILDGVISDDRYTALTYMFNPDLVLDPVLKESLVTFNNTPEVIRFKKEFKKIVNNIDWYQDNIINTLQSKGKIFSNHFAIVSQVINKIDKRVKDTTKQFSVMTPMSSWSKEAKDQLLDGIRKDAEDIIAFFSSVDGIRFDDTVYGIYKSIIEKAENSIANNELPFLSPDAQFTNGFFRLIEEDLIRPLKNLEGMRIESIDEVGKADDFGNALPKGREYSDSIRDLEELLQRAVKPIRDILIDVKHQNRMFETQPLTLRNMTNRMVMEISDETGNVTKKALRPFELPLYSKNTIRYSDTKIDGYSTKMSMTRKKKNNEIFSYFFKKFDVFKKTAYPVVDFETGKLPQIIERIANAVGVDVDYFINELTFTNIDFDKPFTEFNKMVLEGIYKGDFKEMLSEETLNSFGEEGLERVRKIVAEILFLNKNEFVSIDENKFEQFRNVLATILLDNLVLKRKFKFTHVNPVVLPFERAVKEIDATSEIWKQIQKFYTNASGEIDAKGIQKYFQTNRHERLVYVDPSNGYIRQLNTDNSLLLKNVLERKDLHVSVMSEDSFLKYASVHQRREIKNPVIRWMKDVILRNIKLASLTFSIPFIVTNALAAAVQDITSTEGTVNVASFVRNFSKAWSEYKLWKQPYEVIGSSYVSYYYRKMHNGKYKDWADFIDDPNFKKYLTELSKDPTAFEGVVVASKDADIVKKEAEGILKLIDQYEKSNSFAKIKQFNEYMRTASVSGQSAEFNNRERIYDAQKDNLEQLKKYREDHPEDVRYYIYKDTPNRKDAFEAMGYTGDVPEFKDINDEYKWLASQGKLSSNLRHRKNQLENMLNRARSEKATAWLEKTKFPKMFLDFNGDMETVFRTTMLKSLMEEGSSLDKAASEVIRRHFLYTDKSLAEQYSEFIIPFISYPLRSLNLFDELIDDSSIVEMMYLWDKYSWGDAEEQRKKSDYLTSRKAKGDIPVGNLLLKGTNPFTEALMIPADLGGSFKNKLNPVIRTATGMSPVTQLPGISIASNLVQGLQDMSAGNYVPGQITGLANSFYRNSQYFYSKQPFTTKVKPFYNNLYTSGGFSRIAMNMQPTTLKNVQYRVGNILYKRSIM